MIAVLGDTHLGASLYQYDLTPAIMQVMDAFFDFCQEHDVKTAIHLGDLFDMPRPSLELEQLAFRWARKFEEANIKLWMLTGNHDAVSSPQVKTALSSLKEANFKKALVVDKPMPIMLSGTMGGLLLPFPSPGIHSTQQDWNKAITRAVRGIKRPRFVVFTHLNVVGAKLGNQEWLYKGGDHDVPDLLLVHERVPKVFNGHIHKEQQVGKVHCLGAAQRLTFGEAGNPINFTLVKPTLNDVDVEKHQQPGLKLKQLDLDLSGWGNQGTPPSTQQVQVILSCLNVAGALVKINLFADEQTTVTVDKIRQMLMDAGALHVVAPPPTYVKRKLQQQVSRQQVGDPLKLGQFWIKTNIPDKQEQLEVYKCFKSLHRKVSSDG